MLPSSLAFLRSLKKNNNREWFEKNRDRYESTRADVMETVDRFIAALSKKDPSIGGLKARECVFRIYRDVRFSKNKAPYKTSMGAYIGPGGKKSTAAGYYLHIEPGGSFLAGGKWMPDAEELRKIRQEIDYNGKELKKILNAKKFKETFGGLDPEHALKTTPKNYTKDHPDIGLLRLTSFIAWCPFDDFEVESEGFPKTVAKKAELLVPFNRFFNLAIND